MQALIVLAIFGILAGLVGSFAALNTDSTLNLMAAQRAEQQRTFENIATVVTGRLVPDHFQSPGAAGEDNPAEYVCSRIELRALVTCSAVPGGVMQDVWGNPVAGFMRQVPNVAFYGETAGNAGIFALRAPVTAFVLASGGPDGQLDSRLQTDLNNLGGSSSIASIMRLSAYRNASGSAGDSLDDVVYTFSDQRAQEKNWAASQNSLNRIAAAAIRRYQNQFYRFQQELPDVYSAAFQNINTPFSITSATLSQWKSAVPDSATIAVAPPSFTDMQTQELGIDDELARLQRTFPGGGSFAVNFSAPANDVLDISLAVSSVVPWSLASPANCSVSPPVNCIRIQGGS